MTEKAGITSLIIIMVIGITEKGTNIISTTAMLLLLITNKHVNNNDK